jgi:hypothetical protein
MQYAVYNVKTSALAKTFKNGCTKYGTHLAKSAATRLLNKMRETQPEKEWAVTDTENYYANVERQVERKNLMSGLPFMESINTPHYCSPAFESYWTM